MRAWLVALLGVAGCFTDTNAVDASGGDGTSTTHGGSSGGTTAAGSSGGETSGSSSQVADSESSGGDTTTAACPQGSDGCPCIPGPMPACDPGLQCVEGMCGLGPRDCVIRYGGADKSVMFSVTTVDPMGVLSEGPEISIAGLHEPTDVMVGQDMLTACGSSIYAVLADEAAIVSLSLNPDDGLTEVQRLPLPLKKTGLSLRALECTNDGQTLVAVALSSGPVAGEQLGLWAVARDPDGMLTAPAAAVPVASPSPTPNEVGIAWAEVGQRGYVMYAEPVPTNSSHVLDFTIDDDGAIALGAGPSLTIGLSGGVGAIELSPDETILGLVGAVLGNEFQQGIGARFPINTNGTVNLGFQTTSGGYDTAQWGAASSLRFADLPGIGPVALAAGDGQVIVIDFAAAPGPEELLLVDIPGAGPGAVLPAHGGQVVVATNRTGLVALDGSAPLETFADPPHDPLTAPMVAFSTAVVVPCP
ncbi:MAG: hypothetical protein AAF721_20615 [Myxococcota bacterium]